MNIPKRLAFCVLFLIGAGLCASAHALQMLHRNLQEISAISERAFVGKCVAVREIFEPEKNIPPQTEYTFEITDVLKGELGSTLTFRQHGLLRPHVVGENAAYVGRSAAMPVYREGQEYVIFLIGDSSLGLTSPVGLYQGVFLIKADETGKKYVMNGNNNIGLFRDMKSEKKKEKAFSQKEANLLTVKKGPVDYHAFISMIKKLTQP